MKPEASDSTSGSLDEKRGECEVAEKASVDDAGANEGSVPPPPRLSPEEQKRAYRKVDLRLMPMLTLMYLASFLDRGAFHFRSSLHPRSD